MAQNPVYVGRVWGDDTGDPAPVAFGKINTDIAQLFAAVGGGGGGGGSVSLGAYGSAILVADANNFTLGGTFPDGTYQLEFFCNTADINLSGMQAGTFNGQSILLRNAPSSTFNLILPSESSGSNPGNRWSTNPGSLGLTPGDAVFAVYCLPSSRWWLV